MNIFSYYMYYICKERQPKKHATIVSLCVYSRLLDLDIYLSIYLSVCLSVCLSVYLSINFIIIIFDYTASDFKYVAT